MCRSVDCPKCQGKSWTGCGLHVPSAMNSVPKEQWCTCTDAEGKRGEYPPKAGEAMSPLMTVVLLLVLGYLGLKFFKK